MGWIRDDGQEHSYDHEGYIVAVVRDDGRWRELRLGDKARSDSFGMRLQVACECGWRSQRMVPPLGTEWSPCLVMFRSIDGEAFEDAGGEIWSAHMDQVTADSSSALVARGHELRRARFGLASL